MHRLAGHDTSLAQVYVVHDRCRTEVVGRLSELERFRANLTGRWAVIAVLVGGALALVNGVLAAWIADWMRR